MASSKNVAIFLCVSVLSLQCIHYARTLVDYELMHFVRDFFLLKNVSTLVIFACSEIDRQNVLKFLTLSSRLWLYAPGDEQRAATLQTILPQDFYSVGVFLDYTCPAGRETLALNSGREYLNGSHHWLVSSDSRQVPREVDELRLRLDSELVWATRENGTITLHDLYKIDHNWPVVRTVAGSWHVSTGLRYNLTQWKYHASRRGDLQGITLSAVLVVENVSRDNIVEDMLHPKSRIKDSMAYFSYHQHVHIRRMLNFTDKLIPETAYGFVVQDDAYEGLVKYIGENEVNMSISILVIDNHNRIDHIQYIPAPTWKFRMTSIFRHPPMTGGYLALLRAFSAGLWLFAMLMWLLIAVFLRLLAWTQAAVAQHTLENPEERHSWSDVMLLITGTLAEQGTDLNSYWITWRLVFFMMLVLTVLLNNYFNAGVVSSLLSKAPNNIKTLRDLIDSEVQFGAEKNHYINKFFELANNPLVKELYQKKMMRPNNQKPIYYTQEEGIKKVLDEEFAFHLETVNIYGLIEETFPDEEKCSLTEIDVYPTLKGYMLVPFKSPLKEILTTALMRVGESGMLSYMYLYMLPQKPTCSSQEEMVSVGTQYVVPTFAILFIGMLLSLMMVAVESIWRYFSP